jgi:hypothetical protein
MKTSLEHLPEVKREQLAAIAAHLSAGAPVDNHELRLGQYFFIDIL